MPAMDRLSDPDGIAAEIRSTELERLLAEGLTLVERRNALALKRDQATELHELYTGHVWWPRSGCGWSHCCWRWYRRAHVGRQPILLRGLSVAFASGDF